MRIPNFFNSKHGMGICRYFCFQYHSSVYTLQEPSYWGKITLVSIQAIMVLTQLTIQVYKDLSHFDRPTKYQYLIGITNVTPMAKLFDTICDVDY